MLIRSKEYFESLLATVLKKQNSGRTRAAYTKKINVDKANP